MGVFLSFSVIRIILIYPLLHPVKRTCTIVHLEMTLCLAAANGVFFRNIISYGSIYQLNIICDS